MKTKLLLVIFAISTTCLAQTQNIGGVPFPAKEGAKGHYDFNTTFGSWVSPFVSYPGIKTRAKINTYISKKTSTDYESWGWSVEIQNTYTKKVYIELVLGGTKHEVGKRIPIQKRLVGSHFNSGYTYSGVLNPGETKVFRETIWNHEYDVSIHQMHGELLWTCFDFKPGTNIQNCPTNDVQNNSQSSLTAADNLNIENTNNQQQQVYTQEQQRLQQEQQRTTVQSQQFIDVYNEGVRLNNQGRYSEAGVKYQEALRMASTPTQRQQAQGAYERTSKAGNQVQTINALTDVVKLFSDRKRALKNSLTNEDANVLMGITNANNPYDYAGYIVDIFSDLGYTHVSTDISEKFGSTMHIYFKGNDIIEFPMSIFVRKADYTIYNTISFTSVKKKKLGDQLIALQGNLSVSGDNFEIKGVPPYKQEEANRLKQVERQAEIAKEQQVSNARLRMEELKPQFSNRPIDEGVTAKSVVERYIKAIGGEEKLKAVRNIYIHKRYDRVIGKDYYHFIEMETTTTYGKYFDERESSNYVRYKNIFTGDSFYQIKYGKYGKKDKKKKLKKDKQTISNLSKNTQPFEDIFIKLQNPKLSLYPTMVSIEGKDCYALSVVISDEEIIYFFDKYNGLWIGENSIYEAKGTSISPPRKYYTFFEDYREVDGILFPFKKINFSDDASIYAIINVDKIKINNPHITDRSFR